MRPRIRTVKPEMRQDERYARLSYPARELFNGLITLADDEGRFRAPTSGILGHVFPYDGDAPKKLREWVEEIRDSGMVLFYVTDGVPYGAFRHWRRHQKINRPRPSDLPPPPDHDIVRDNSVEDQGKDTEHSVNDQGDNTDRSLSHAQACVPDPDPVPVLSMPTAELRTRALCHRLAIHIRRNDPRTEPNYESQRWTTDMRLLVTARGGGEPAFLEVERVIDWCQADSFWRSNILSPAKLRKQFTQLVLKADAKPPLRVVSQLHTSRETTPEVQARIDQRLAELRADDEEAS